MKQIVQACGKLYASGGLIYLSSAFWFAISASGFFKEETFKSVFLTAWSIKETSVEGIGVLIGVFLAITYKSMKSGNEKAFFLMCLFFHR